MMFRIISPLSLPLSPPMFIAPGTFNLQSAHLCNSLKVVSDISMPLAIYLIVFIHGLSILKHTQSVTFAAQTPNLLKTILSRYANTVNNTLCSVTPTSSYGCDILALLKYFFFHVVCLAASALNSHYLLPVIVFFFRCQPIYAQSLRTSGDQWYHRPWIELCWLTSVLVIGYGMVCCKDDYRKQSITEWI